MIRRQRPEFRRQGGAAEVGELLGVELDRQTGGSGGLEHSPDLGGRETDTLAEGVDAVRQAARRDLADQAPADGVDVAVGIAGEFRRGGVGGQKGGDDADRSLLAEFARRLEHLGFVGQVEAVARLDLHRGNALGDQGVEAGQGGADQIDLAGGAGGAHGGEDAAALAGDLLITRPGQAPLELTGAIAGEDQMSVAIDQTRRDPAALAIDRRDGVEAGRLSRRTGEDDLAVGRRHQAIGSTSPSPGPGHGGQARVPPEGVAAHGACFAACAEYV